MSVLTRYHPPSFTSIAAQWPEPGDRVGEKPSSATRPPLYLMALYQEKTSPRPRGLSLTQRIAPFPSLPPLPAVMCGLSLEVGFFSPPGVFFFSKV